jgi:hypothetical protein
MLIDVRDAQGELVLAHLHNLGWRDMQAESDVQN